MNGEQRRGCLDTAVYSQDRDSIPPLNRHLQILCQACQDGPDWKSWMSDGLGQRSEVPRSTPQDHTPQLCNCVWVQSVNY